MGLIRDASCVVLAGGQGKRMGGRQKALLEVDGETLFARQMMVLAPLFSDIAVSANEDIAHPTVLRDETPGQGPLAGIASGLGWCPSPWLFVVACDMPDISIAAVQVLADAREGDLLVPGDDRGIEPLFAFYRVQACAPVICERLANGQLKLQELAQEPRLQVRKIAPSGALAAALTNWNRPEDMP